jgi:nitrate reductase gamma subunit
MEKTLCSSRLVNYGILSIVIGIFVNMVGKRTMDLYDVTKEDVYKYVSIAIFSVGVVLVAYGLANIFLRDSLPMCMLLAL